MDDIVYGRLLGFQDRVERCLNVEDMYEYFPEDPLFVMALRVSDRLRRWVQSPLRSCRFFFPAEL